MKTINRQERRLTSDEQDKSLVDMVKFALELSTARGRPLAVVQDESGRYGVCAVDTMQSMTRPVEWVCSVIPAPRAPADVEECYQATLRDQGYRTRSLRD